MYSENPKNTRRRRDTDYRSHHVTGQFGGIQTEGEEVKLRLPQDFLRVSSLVDTAG